MNEQNQSPTAPQEVQGEKETITLTKEKLRSLIGNGLAAGLILATDPKYKMQTFIKDKEKFIDEILNPSITTY